MFGLKRFGKSTDSYNSKVRARHLLRIESEFGRPPHFQPLRIKSTEISQPLLKQLCLQMAFLGSKVKGAPTIFFNLNDSKVLQGITEFNHFWIFLQEMALKKKILLYAMFRNPKVLAALISARADINRRTQSAEPQKEGKK